MCKHVFSQCITIVHRKHHTAEQSHSYIARLEAEQGIGKWAPSAKRGRGGITLMYSVALQIRLSDTASVAIKMPLTGRDGEPIQAVLTQQDFDRLSADLFRRARLPLDEACWQVLLFFDRSLFSQLTVIRSLLS